MKRFCTIFVILCLLPLNPAVGQDKPAGAEFGMLIGDFEPTPIYALGYDISGLPGPVKWVAQKGLPPFLRDLVENGSATVFYSDAQWGEGADEMYAVRALVEKDAQVWRGLTLESGLGAWHFFNTGGNDDTRWGFMAGLSFDTGPLDVRLAGDLIGGQGKSDMYAVRLRLGFSL